MAKKEVKTFQEKFLEYKLEDLMGERFGEYSKYIIQDRALPDARDGLKPVQRRILYGMMVSGNTHNKPYLKSARTVGDVMGKYHPHGDSSIYDALVRMSQWWKMRIPLIDMQGNNGSIDNDSAAAMRYTEARLAKISAELMRDIDCETVPFTLTYDDSHLEPTVMPARFPNLLVNGSKGIAAGYVAGLISRALKGWNKYVSVMVAAIAAPIVNSGLFSIAMMTVFKETLYTWAGDTPVLSYVLLSLIGVNFLIELVINILFAPSLVKLKKAINSR